MIKDILPRQSSFVCYVAIKKLNKIKQSDENKEKVKEKEDRKHNNKVFYFQK